MISYIITDNPIHYNPSDKPIHIVVTTEIDYVVGNEIYYIAREA